MRQMWACVCLALLVMGGAKADMQPEKLADFRLDDSKLLKGFVKSARQAEALPLGETPGLMASLNSRYFHALNEVRYSVLLFADRKALQSWCKSYLSSLTIMRPPAVWPTQPKEELPLAGIGARIVAVNRVVIVLYGFTHTEAARKDPKAEKASLSDRAFALRLKQLGDELSARAGTLPANKP